MRRSPLRTPADAATLAEAALARDVRVVGVMFYEAQIACARQAIGDKNTIPQAKTVNREVVDDTGGA